MLREADSVRVEEDVDATFAPALAMRAQGAGQDAVAAIPAQRYGEGKRFNWSGAILTVLIHAILIAAFFMIKDHVVKKREEKLTVVNLTPAPPPSTPEQQVPQQVAVVTPRPIVQIPQPSPVPLLTTPDPVPQPTPPAPPSAVSVPPAPPAPPSVIQLSDIGSRMVSGNPPRYPIDSRRQHEQGTVVLSLTLGFDGRVASISVSHSSGSERLDDAALSAVRKWRWEPIMRGGQPVMVRGLVEIPFVLKS